MKKNTRRRPDWNNKSGKSKKGKETNIKEYIQIFLIEGKETLRFLAPIQTFWRDIFSQAKVWIPLSLRKKKLRWTTQKWSWTYGEKQRRKKREQAVRDKKGKMEKIEIEIGKRSDKSKKRKMLLQIKTHAKQNLKQSLQKCCSFLLAHWSSEKILGLVLWDFFMVDFWVRLRREQEQVTSLVAKSFIELAGPN